MQRQGDGRKVWKSPFFKNDVALQSPRNARAVLAVLPLLVAETECPEPGEGGAAALQNRDFHF